MFTAVRALVWATLFVSLMFVYLPSQVLVAAGIAGPDTLGWQQVAGMVIGSLGALIALWCWVAFVAVGKGTPAPFDPPQRLVTSGPYRFVRNPMYVGAGGGLTGAALYFESWQLIAYTAILFVLVNLLIVSYEEPTLRRMFGKEFEEYVNKVNRWLPRF